jgi:PKD repeat protein
VNGNPNQAHYGADYGRTEINDNTNPSPFLQNGQPGGLSITNIGFVGETISFDVFFEKEPVADFTASETVITPGCAVNFTDESLCEVSSWQWTFEGGTPTYSAEQNPQGITWNNPGTYSVMLTANNSWGSDTETKSGFIVVSDNALPEIEFFAVDSITCTGGTIILNDYSSVCSESWLWDITPTTFQFVEGTNASSQNPVIQLNETGFYSVSLTVSNANGNANLVKEDYLKAGGASIPFSEDFENGLTDKGWIIVNPNNDMTWEEFTVSGNIGTRAAGINLFEYYSILKRDQLISPSLDLSNSQNAVVHFNHAYALKNSISYSDSLIVKISDDCGNTWTRILELAEDGSGNFRTHTPMIVNFIPAIPEDWCFNSNNNNCNIADISQWAGHSDVNIMFESVRLTGNNLFIDNVIVEPYTSVNKPLENDIRFFNVIPNPSNGIMTLRCNNELTNGMVQVYNSFGQIILNDEIVIGAKEKILDLSRQKEGLYFIRLTGTGIDAVEKVLIH